MEQENEQIPIDSDEDHEKYYIRVLLLLIKKNQTIFDKSLNEDDDEQLRTSFQNIHQALVNYVDAHEVRTFREEKAFVKHQYSEKIDFKDFNDDERLEMVWKEVYSELRDLTDMIDSPVKDDARIYHQACELSQSINIFLELKA